MVTKEIFAVLFILSVLAIPVLLFLNRNETRTPRWGNLAWSIVFSVQGTWFAAFDMPSAGSICLAALTYTIAISNLLTFFATRKT